MFAAVLDTNSIVPSLRRDFLLSLAVEGSYRPLWSEAILAELHAVTIRLRVRRGIAAPSARSDADRLVAEMRTHFDDALVTGWEGLDGTYCLPDSRDEHVVAAAIVGGAGVVVTENTRDFPRDRVPANLDVQKPAAFAADTVDVDPAAAVRALNAMATCRVNPQESPAQLLKRLVEIYGMDDVGEMLEPLV